MDERVALVNSISSRVIGACIEVHKTLGPGLLESAYEECVSYELSLAGCQVTRQQPLPIHYKGVRLDCGYRMDLVVDSLVIVELKTVDQIAPVHEAQLMTYLRLARMPLGLLINFNVPLLRQGIKRLAYNLYPDLIRQ